MNSPATVEEDDAPAPSTATGGTGVYRDAEGLPSPCHRDYEGKRTQFKDDDDNEEPCFLDALPDAILQHTLAFTTGASVVRAAASAKRLLRACQTPPLWSALGRAAFQRHDCARPFPANWDVVGRSLAPWLRASFPKSWPRSMLPPPPPRALASGRRDDRPLVRDLDPLGQTACEYLTALDGTGYDVCVRSDAPFDLRAPRGARLVVPHQNRWACVGGAYFEVSIASGATRVPGVTPCVAVGVCQRAFKLRGKQPGWTRSSWAYHAVQKSDFTAPSRRTPRHRRYMTNG